MEDTQPIPQGVPPLRSSPLPRRPGPPGVAQQARGFVRFFYTSNPFYVISALLVLWGLWRSFDITSDGVVEMGKLMAGLTAYILLLAAAAWFLIRVGKLWNDVRTVLLVIVLMFFAMSMSFDRLLTTDAQVGMWFFLLGLAFAIVLSEVLLRGIQLSLRAWFRVPYYLFLTLFFLYPLALSPLQSNPENPVLLWRLFGFSSIAGLIMLTLLPAVRRGRAYVADNGSPWPWPQFPWSLFVFLGVCAGVRTYCLCVSFHPVKGEATIFAPYFLIPLLLAVNVLLLEIGIVSRHKITMLVGLIAPVGLLFLAATDPCGLADDFGFLATFVGNSGAYPLYWTLLAVAVLYGMAVMRRVPHSVEALTTALALFAFCGPDTFNASAAVGPQPIPILLIGLLHGGIAVYRHSSGRCLIAACCIAAAVAIALDKTALAARDWVVLFHCLIAAVLLIGAVFHDRFAKAMQYAGAPLILIAGVAAAVVDPQWFGDVSPLLPAVYPAAAVLVAAAYGYLVRNRWYYAAAIATLACWSMVAGWAVYALLRKTLLGLDQIAVGLLFFLLAMLISLTKMGVPQRWIARCRRPKTLKSGDP